MNIDPHTIAEKAWGFISPKMPEANELLNKAKEVGANATQDTTAVMNAIEKFMSSRGKAGALQNNMVWQSCKGKNPKDLIQHLKKCGMQSGKLDFIFKLLGMNN